MPIWEYKVVLLDARSESRVQGYRDMHQRTLDNLGREGWELVNVDGNVGYFKRPGAEASNAEREAWQEHQK